MSFLIVHGEGYFKISIKKNVIVFIIKQIQKLDKNQVFIFKETLVTNCPIITFLKRETFQ